MNKTNNIILVSLSLSFLLVTCSNYEQKIIRDIKLNPKYYSKIIETVNKCDFSRFEYNQYISKDYFPKKLHNAIRNTELRNVEYLIISKYSNCNAINIELISDKLRIRYEACPGAEFPKVNSYEKVGLIERWGISGNWMIWKNNDVVF